MGKTFRRNSEERFTDQRRGGKPKRSKQRGGKLKTLNSSSEVDYDIDDAFDDEFGLYDEIQIEHIKKHTT